MTTTTIDIDRPAQQVYAYVTDPTQFHEWQEGVVSGGLKEPGPAAVGSHCQMVRRISGISASLGCELRTRNDSVHGVKLQ